MRNRNGQITLFVILGIVIIILLLLLLFMKRTPTSDVKSLPPQFQKVGNYVQQCLKETTIDALKQMAMHGGYLDPIKQLNITPGKDPTESKAVSLNPADPESAVPYYFYLTGKNNCRLCTLSTLAPTKEYMERELHDYLLSHLGSCLHFDSFPDYVVKMNPDQKIQVTLNNNSVDVVYDRVTTITKDGSVKKPKRFVEKIDIPFLTYYNLAIQITQKEVYTQFLENYLLYIVGVYSGRDADLPPLGDYDESFSPPFWILFNVQKTYAKLLNSITPSLQVMGTKGYRNPPLAKDLVARNVIPASEKDYIQGFLDATQLNLVKNAERYRISILYPDYKPYVDVHPRAGQIIRPRSAHFSGLFVLPPRQQNYYDFYYDISAPFIFEIRDENAIPGTDISFLFSLEANVRENKNMAQWLLGKGTLPWSYDFVNYKITDPATSLPADQRPKKNKTKVFYQHNDSLKTLLCDPTQAVVPVTVRTFDGHTKKPLTNVTISFTCGLYSSCPAGFTSPDAQNIYAVSNEKLPQCIGGLLKAEKAGYASKSVRLSTQVGMGSQTVDITLFPFVKKNVTVVKYTTHIDGWDILLDKKNPKVLDKKDTVFITFIRKIQEYGDSQVMSTVFIDNETNMSTVSLTPGLYEVRATYLTKHKMVIPKGCKKEHGQDVPDKDIELNETPWGGLSMTNKTQYWQVESNDLYKQNHLIVPVFVAPEPRCIDDLNFMDTAQRFTRQFHNKAKPKFVD